MISKIISRAACLTELASNPKSFSNCPDLHGGVPRLAEDKMDLSQTGVCPVKPRSENNSSYNNELNHQVDVLPVIYPSP